MFPDCTRWDAGGVQEDDQNVPLQLKKVLATMKSDSPEPAHHHGFLHCLDRNHVRREADKHPKFHPAAAPANNVFLLLLLRFCSQQAARCRRGFPRRPQLPAATNGRHISGMSPPNKHLLSIQFFSCI